jgi:hypothetical protein
VTSLLNRNAFLEMSVCTCFRISTASADGFWSSGAGDGSVESETIDDGPEAIVVVDRGALATVVGESVGAIDGANVEVCITDVFGEDEVKPSGVGVDVVTGVTTTVEGTSDGGTSDGGTSDGGTSDGGEGGSSDGVEALSGSASAGFVVGEPCPLLFGATGSFGAAGLSGAVRAIAELDSAVASGLFTFTIVAGSRLEPHPANASVPANRRPRRFISLHRFRGAVCEGTSSD